jgi:serine/threonine protein phosphatase PrpC
MSTGSLSMRPGSTCGIASFAGVTMGARKQQDRFLILPNLVEGVLYCGVFDGHAEEGHIVAERAARTIASDLMKNLAWLADKSEKMELPQFEERVASAFTQTFVNFHAVLAAEYENEVASPVEKMRLAMEKSEGVELPRCLPMKGGTTATTGIIHGKYLGIAWVGDSRAVLCCVDAAGNLTAQDLTRDHNVDSKAERERAETRGGVVVGRHIVVDGADGMVQVHHLFDSIESEESIRAHLGAPLAWASPFASHGA